MVRGFQHIESMYAYIVLDPADGTEGIPSFFDPASGTHVPLVGADVERASSLRPLAERIAKELNATVTLVHFTNRTEVERIGIPDAPD